MPPRIANRRRVGLVGLATLATLTTLLTSACGTFGFGRPVPVVHETQVTPSGIVLEDLQHGVGRQAMHGSLVRVHYRASLEDGTLFDSSYDRGEPQEFTLGKGEVIPGWEEGMLGMRESGRRRMVIPPELAYGASGREGLIPPDSKIVLEVELVHVEGP